MFTAKGVGAQRNADGTVTVLVDVWDDKVGKTVQTLKFSGKDLDDVKSQIADQLNALAAAADDAALSAAVVGQVLGQSSAPEGEAKPL